jgi:hypothetical protein
MALRIVVSQTIIDSARKAADPEREVKALFERISRALDAWETAPDVAPNAMSFLPAIRNMVSAMFSEIEESVRPRNPG